MDDLLFFGRDNFSELANSLLASGIPVEFTARGGSMAPTFMDGDRIRLIPCETASLKEGDVVACLDDEDCIIVHRIVAIERKDGKRIIITRGDALEYSDPPVEEKRIIAIAEPAS
jgi:signal peptidase I